MIKDHQGSNNDNRTAIY